MEIYLSACEFDETLVTYVKRVVLFDSAIRFSNFAIVFEIFAMRGVARNTWVRGVTLLDAIGWRPKNVP